jgi:hypothetical protein
MQVFRVVQLQHREEWCPEERGEEGGTGRAVCRPESGAHSYLQLDFLEHLLGSEAGCRQNASEAADA